MTTPVIIDIVAAAVLAGFTIAGMKRGLLRTLAGLLVVIVALVGAAVMADALAEPAAKLAAPAIQKHIQRRMDEALPPPAEPGRMPESEPEGDLGPEELLALLGLDREARESIAEEVRQTVRDTGMSIAAAVVESLARSLLYGILYILSFLALLALGHLLVRALDLVLKLPVLHGLNSLGGGLAGLAEAALLLFLAVWVLRHLGVSFDTETVDATYILRFFTTHTPLSVLGVLQ